jgi:hypothetical protein
MTDEEIFKNHTQWLIDNYGKKFMQFIKNLHIYRTYVLHKVYVSEEYPYNGYTECVPNATLFYLKRFGVNVIEDEKCLSGYGKIIQWNDEFVHKLDVALKIVTLNEKMNKLNKDFEV